MSTFGDIKVSTINGGPTGAKNAIINGNFGINQRDVSGTVTLSAGVYGHDRWKAGSSGCTYTFATSGNVTTLTISAGSLIQVIEGINLESGTYTLSWTGTAQGKIGAGSYGNSGITGTATGGTNLNIEFDTGTVSLVQFEPGTVATPFERRQFGQELALCQRYYYRITSRGVGYFGCGTNNGTTNNISIIPFPVSMRTHPTALEQSGTAGHYQVQQGGTLTTCSAVPVYNYADTDNATVQSTVASGLTIGYAAFLRAVNSSAFLAWSAEL
jgi:hypothetical protein